MVYIGSSVNMHARYIRHLYDTENGSLNYLHRALREFGFDAFDFDVIERLPKEKLLEREEFWIRFFNSASLDGFNTRRKPTATYVREVSEITRKRIGLVHKGRKASETTRKKMSVAAKERGRSPEHTEKLRSVHVGRKLSKEHLEKLRAANVGRKMSPEATAKSVASKQAKIKARQLAGLPGTQQSIAGLAARVAGRKAAADLRKLAGIPARKQSPEHVAKRMASGHTTRELKALAKFN